MSTDQIEAEAEQRRAIRAAHIAAGGSKRRPLKSYRTDAEKRAEREQHADRLREAVAHIRTPEGFGDWMHALEVNPTLSPLNCALVALQAPGRVVDTHAGWKRGGYAIPKGERATVRLTGPGFWPKAAWTAEQVGAADIAEMIPAPAEQPAELLDALCQRLAAEKQRAAVDGFAAEHCGRVVSYARPLKGGGGK